MHRDLEASRLRERRRPRWRDAHVQPAGRDAGAPRFMESRLIGVALFGLLQVILQRSKIYFPVH